MTERVEDLADGPACPGPACVLGMHRAGTSAVARVLAECGLWLGDDLMPAAPDNPRGFFENVEFVRLNDMILAELGGAWDVPPSLRDGWERTEALAPLAREALGLAASMGSGPWGWKDPRNTLTLDFWASLLPELRVVVCVRNPLSVARSLSRRSGCSLRMGVDLWLRYSRRALAAAERGACAVTHYESYFLDPLREVERVARAAGLAPAPDALERAGASVEPDLRHDAASAEDLVSPDVPHEVLDVYLRLCESAGPVYAPVAAAERTEVVERAVAFAGKPEEYSAFARALRPQTGRALDPEPPTSSESSYAELVRAAAEHAAARAAAEARAHKLEAVVLATDARARELEAAVLAASNRACELEAVVLTASNRACELEAVVLTADARARELEAAAAASEMRLADATAYARSLEGARERAETYARSLEDARERAETYACSLEAERAEREGRARHT